jgi:hypothetical protein
MVPIVDKEFAELIPPLSEDEYSQLEKNLLAEGCRDRLVVWGDILIDGHNRLQICNKHNIPYDIVTVDFVDRNDAIAYIILNQFGRRNLSIGNRSILALKLEPIYKAQAKNNQKQSPGRGKKGTQKSAYLFTGETRKKIAEIAGVSHNTIDRVKKIVEHGTSEQVERIKDGGKGNSINAVYDEIRRLSAPPPLPVEAGGTQDNRKTEPPAAEPAIDEAKSELEQIKGYVADLKNPDLNRAFTADMFLAEYEAFAERFVRGVGAFREAPYRETYSLLSLSQRKKMNALGDRMIEAIQNQISMIWSETA